MVVTFLSCFLDARASLTAGQIGDHYKGSNQPEVLEEVVQRNEARHTFQTPEAVRYEHRHHRQRSQPSRSEPREPVEDNAQGAGYLHEKLLAQPRATPGGD